MPGIRVDAKLVFEPCFGEIFMGSMQPFTARAPMVAFANSIMCLNRRTGWLFFHHHIVNLARSIDFGKVIQCPMPQCADGLTE